MPFAKARGLIPIASGIYSAFEVIPDFGTGSAEDNSNNFLIYLIAEQLGRTVKNCMDCFVNNGPKAFSQSKTFGLK